MKAVVALAGLAGLALGCHKDPKTLDREAARGVFQDVEFTAPPGLSGLAVDERGVVWAVPERDRLLVEIVIPPAGPTLPKPTTKLYPLDGIPDGMDTEGLAWLGGGKIAVSLEGQTDSRAAVAFAERRGDRFVVTTMRSFGSTELGVTLTNNHGAEGACGVGDDVLLAIESVGTLPDGVRYAPIVRIAGATTAVWKLRLSTSTGKISVLDCAIAANGDAHVWALERHYGVSRIVRFTVPRGAPTGPLAEAVFVDLAPIVRDALNLEGIVELPDGRLVVVNDNQGRHVEGPVMLLVFPRPAPGSHIKLR